MKSLAQIPGTTQRDAWYLPSKISPNILFLYVILLSMIAYIFLNSVKVSCAYILNDYHFTLVARIYFKSILKTTLVFLF